MLTKLSPGTKTSLSVLIAVNLMALVGIIAFGWDTFTIILAYWLESAIIGFYSILKLIFSKGEIKTKKVPPKFRGLQKTVNRAAKIFLIPFFIVHFGAFMVIHFFFITILSESPGQTIAQIPLIALTLGVGLFVSHGISFWNNYIKNNEYKKANPQNLMLSPYKRVIIMHATIIFGAMLSVPAMILILLKTIIDIIAHLRERKAFKKA